MQVVIHTWPECDFKVWAKINLFPEAILTPNHGAETGLPPSQSIHTDVGLGIIQAWLVEQTALPHSYILLF